MLTHSETCFLYQNILNVHSGIVVEMKLIMKVLENVDSIIIDRLLATRRSRSREAAYWVKVNEKRMVKVYLPLWIGGA